MTQITHETEDTTLVNQVIYDFFERSIDHATSIDPSYRELWENLYTLVRSGGKRLRPQMTMLAYEAFGGKDRSAIIPVAAAQELLHVGLLIHDDIIDRDYVRHSKPNIAGMYDASYAKFISNTHERLHYANSAALLGGDLMLSGAYQLIATSTFTDKDKMIAQGLLTHGIFEVAGGELLDTESNFTPYTPGDALKIAKYKSASYSFVTPLLTGATLAGMKDEQTDILRSFARSLGVAYQLVDDILGVFGNEQETGKSTSGDIREGKYTYIVEQATTAMSSVDKIIFDRSFGNPKATLREMAAVRDIFVTTGARQKTEDTIIHYTQEARIMLQRLALDKPYHDKFEQLIHAATRRLL